MAEVGEIKDSAGQTPDLRNKENWVRKKERIGNATSQDP